jgi:hypothetical protein
MIAAGAFLSVLALVAIVAVALSLRSVVEDHERTESRLRDPRTHTVTYAIPNGFDPVVFAVSPEEMRLHQHGRGVGRDPGPSCGM